MLAAAAVMPSAAERTAAVRVLSGGAMRSLMKEAVPAFERASGIKVEIRFALTSALEKEIAAGAVFDVAMLPRPEIEALARHGKIASGTPTDITRSAIGLCVRSGARKPDIGSVEAFKRALLGAASLGYSDGPSGAYVAELLGRLGIAEAMKAKTRLTSAPVAELVAEGGAEIGIQQIVAILPVEGAEPGRAAAERIAEHHRLCGRTVGECRKPRTGARFYRLHGDARSDTHDPRERHGAGLTRHRARSRAG